MPVSPDPLPVVSPAAQWAIVSGFFLPLLIAVIVQTHWSREFKTATGFVVCMAATAVQLGIQQKLSAHNFFPTMLLVLTVSISTFQHFWKPLGVANAIEKGTSPQSPTNG